jgi:hypothetical protein
MRTRGTALHLSKNRVGHLPVRCPVKSGSESPFFLSDDEVQVITTFENFAHLFCQFIRVKRGVIEHPITVAGERGNMKSRTLDVPDVFTDYLLRFLVVGGVPALIEHLFNSSGDIAL